MDNPNPAPMAAPAALAALWHDAGLDARALAQVALAGQGLALPTSFAVADALQSAVAASALAAAGFGQARGGPVQAVQVDAEDALCESSAHFLVDGRVPPLWDPLSGLYPCGDARGEPGWVRVHANFAHHRDGALGLLGLPPGATTARDDVTRALRGWRATDFEQAAADAGLVVAAARGFDEWDAHPHAATVAAQPLVGLQREGDAPPPPLRRWREGDRPLRGTRVLDLTRILAGPVAGRTLAAHGADVLLVNSPGLPNIEAIADTSRGKRSAHVDLRTDAGRQTLRALVREADVFLQGYRPGALAALGFGPAELWRLNPSLVCVSLSAYGDSGPWGGRRGFDSLVQTATGFNRAEAAAFGADKPRAMPLQVLDYAAGFLLAFGTVAALGRRQHEGGGWQVEVSLARTGLWLRSLGRREPDANAALPSFDGRMETSASGFGQLQAVRHAARLSHTPAGWVLPSMPPGSHAAGWLGRD